MERELIEAFLAVVNYGTISAAANNTYTTQGSISKKISQLEAEVGVPLFVRSKGLRKVELTAYGKTFLELAGKWEVLNREFEAIKYSNVIQEVSIGATDLVNRITLKEFYHDILVNHSSYRLDLHTYHSPQIYRMMELHQLDLAYVNLLLPVSNIRVRKLFDEDLVVLMNTDSEFPTRISYKDLDPAKEVFSRWNDEFDIWHEQYWPHRQYRIRVGTGSMIEDYLQQKGFWAIVPITGIAGLMKDIHLKYARLDIKTPKRSLYLLEQKHPRQNRAEAIDFMNHQIETFLNAQVESL